MIPTIAEKSPREGGSKHAVFFLQEQVGKPMGHPSPRQIDQPGTRALQWLVVFALIGCLALLFSWALALGPIATAGFVAWAGYLSMFSYFMWRDHREQSRTRSGIR